MTDLKEDGRLKLLPCPFCGERAVEQDPYLARMLDPEAGSQVFCGAGCTMVMPVERWQRREADKATRIATAEACARIAEEAIRFMRHDGLCAFIGGYGYCSCGRDAAAEALDAIRLQQGSEKPCASR